MLAAAVALSAALGLPRAARGERVVPEFQSLPGAHAKLYLDFDGDVTPFWGFYSPGTTIAYDTEGTPDAFSAPEVANIQKIWSGVAEKFSPFNLNVTTVDPGNRNDYETMRIVIGGNGAWVGQFAGGIAPLDGFMTAEPNTGFVFPANLRNGTPRYVADAVAHEAAHGFGIHHQSTFNASGGKTAEYNPGDGRRGPIMGYPYFNTLSQWWNGPGSSGATQDDLQELSGSGYLQPAFGYRDDDHGSTIGAAETLSVSSAYAIAASGIIERNGDADYFSFTTPGGNAFLSAMVNPDAPMLDLTLSLFDANGLLLASSDTDSLGEQFFTPLLEAGTYVVSVTPAGGYGSLGQYSLAGTVIPEPSAAALAAAAGGVALRRRRPRQAC
ncbi:MAG TPA: hypothetical protein VER17_06575 [Tepidisphaeraceae bacterium]|nr:hypothetical protein [Tepidisphaeraceae bacterium]